MKTRWLIFACACPFSTAMHKFLKELAFTGLTKKLFFVWSFVIFSQFVALFIFFFTCWLILQNNYQSLTYKLIGVNPNRPDIFSWTYIFSRTLFTPQRLKRWRQKCLQFTCVTSMTWTQNWQLLVLYPWRQRHFGDVKIKLKKKNAQCGNHLLKWKLVLVSKKSHLTKSI